ncbi:FAD-binding oxidoreductase [Stigmatella aurantiaca]|uniref:Glycolate oxidase subunit n=1 Tax=Stigmatella aurantiaca (strain DW4/3-1) TaxID=378806 RepID=Q08SR9_STIAD|nr:FAD-linked oxidase C-terminal domain-containing protein [Stigmatella aurantiaca]ADO72927.1 glycolate oxidase, GlcD subunit [Stigmatella aurantiaca DW4/3-1]EAU63541.1 glycolate oxidase subunit [Stigmatella aurantiaca DW4/3-1]
MTLPSEKTFPRVEPERLERAWAALSEKLSSGQLRRDEQTRERYSRDESDSGVYPPDIIAFPENTAQVSALFKTCQALGVPFTPCGARSGKSGGALALRGGVMVSLERMNRIRSLSVEDLTAVVEPGVITGDLMRAAEAVGLFYPPDPNSWEFCTLGGNIAENAGGPRALKYGVTRDYVLGLEWVLPDGEVLRVGRRTLKGVAGYDLVGLFVGSEGTLGVATEITLQLIPRPRQVMTALVIFDSVVAAARALTAVLASGLLPRTLELMDDVALRAVAGRGFAFPPGAGSAVILEVDGSTEEGLLAELAQAGEICARLGATETLVAQNEDQREKLWAARRLVSPGLRALKPHKISEDIAVPRSRIPDLIEQLKALGARMGLLVATYGHAGDGNLHANILYEGPHQRPLVEEAIQQMLKLTVEMGGTITGEHGVGHAKRDYLAFEQPAPVIALQRRLKTFFDPSGLLNPEKMFPGPDCF